MGNQVHLDGDLTLTGSNDLSLSGAITGTGVLSKSGTSNVTLSGSNSFSGGLHLNAGKLILANAGAVGTGTITTAAAGAALENSTAQTLLNNVRLDGNLALTGSNDLSLSGAITGTGALSKSGTGNLTLSGSNSFGGGLNLNAGTLILANAAAAGTGTISAGAGGAALQNNSAQTLNNRVQLDGNLTLAGSHHLSLPGTITGTGGLSKNGAATLTLAGANDFAAGVALNAGSLMVGSNTALGVGGALTAAANTTLDASTAVALANAVTLAGNLTIGGTSDLDLNGAITGSGGLIKNGTAALTLAGNNSYAGSTVVNAGTLFVDGAVNGTVQARSGSTLSGSGRIGADVVVASGAVLAAGRNGPGTLTVDGNLTLQAGSASQFDLGRAGVVAGSSNDLISVGGDLTLGGDLTAKAASAGWYRLFNYGKTLSGSFASTQVASTQSGFKPASHSLDIGTAGQVNLSVLGVGQTLQFWNGSQTSGAGSVIGGSGTWKGFDTNWTDSAGNAAQGWGGSVAVFGGAAAGTVTIEGRLAFDTLQFSANGYSLVAGTGASLALTPDTGSQASINTDAGIHAGIAAPITDGSAKALLKVGSGTLSLSGANTYTGGTTVAEGTLVAASDHALGTAGVAVDNAAGHAAALRVHSGVTLANAITLQSGGALDNAGTLAGGVQIGASSPSHVTLHAGSQIQGNLEMGSAIGSALNLSAAGSAAQLHSQAVTGNTTLAGELHKSGTGTWVLDKDLAPVSTNIAGGTLALGNGGTAGGLGMGAITNSGTLAIRRSDDVTLANTITGSGGVQQNGPGTTTLTGANDYTGGTTVSAGRLVASVASLGSGAIANNAVLELNPVTNATLAQAASGHGTFTKTGPGTLTLTADSSAFTGSTQLNAGALALGSGAVLGGSLTVASGATLTGNGTVGSTTLASGARIAPGSTGASGHAYGTLSVKGDLRFQAGTTYQVHADPLSSTSDRIDVTGTAQLAGGVLHVGPEAGFDVARSYTILSASQVTGTFDTVASNYAYLDPSLQYSAAEVSLLLQRKQIPVDPSTPATPADPGTRPIAFADLAQTRNQVAVAKGVESLGATNPLYKLVEALPVGAPTEVFNSLSGEIHSSVKAGLGTAARMFGASTLGHLHSNLTAHVQPGAPIAQSGGSLPASAWPSAKALPAWAEVVGHWQSLSGTSEAARLKQDISGVFAGADTEVGASDWRLGAALGHTRINARVPDRIAKARVDSYSASVYGGRSFGWGPGHLNVMGGLAYSWHDIESERQVTAMSQILKADYRASTTQLFAEAGYGFHQYGTVGVEPFAGISLGRQRTRNFQENGGDAALRGAGGSNDLAATTLGVRAHSDFTLGRTEGRLRGTLGWRHLFGDVNSQTTMAFERGQNFTVVGIPVARNTALVGLDAELELGRRATLVLGYKGEFGRGSRDHSAQARVRWAF